MRLIVSGVSLDLVLIVDVISIQALEVSLARLRIVPPGYSGKAERNRIRAFELVRQYVSDFLDECHVRSPQKKPHAVEREIARKPSRHTGRFLR